MSTYDAVNQEARDTWLRERPDEAEPVLTPYCSLCQRGTGDYVCGPCERVMEPESEQHIHGREESGRVVRLACSCGHKGKWRSRTAYLLEKQLRSDDGAHLYAVRNEGA